jgi:hypothetical protein
MPDPVPVPNPLPAPQLVGFTILRYNLKTNASEIQQALFDAEYNAPTAPLSLDYDATTWIYWLCLEVEYPGPFPPVVFAIFYQGDTRTDTTRIQPLVPPGIGSAETEPIYSKTYNGTVNDIRNRFMIAMQERNPDNDLKDYWYGFLQFDYHYPDLMFKPGTHTIELMLGWGPVKAQPARWSNVMTCQWNIGNYTPP